MLERRDYQNHPTAGTKRTGRRIFVLDVPKTDQAQL
jgi:hypothetical protein